MLIISKHKHDMHRHHTDINNTSVMVDKVVQKMVTCMCMHIFTFFSYLGLKPEPLNFLKLNIIIIFYYLVHPPKLG